jgi:5-hydroxyisourate hydrolase
MRNRSSPITTHVLDTARGRPAAGIPVSLCLQEDEKWQELGRGITDQDGRITDLLHESKLKKGKYRLTFETGQYLASSGKAFFPEVEIVFEIHDPAQHYHVPLLLSPYGYSTYRGS